MTTAREVTPYARKAGRAVSHVGAAVRSGRLAKLPCVDCGAEKVEAHHPNGYDREHELDVIWLCRIHHLHRHGRGMKPSWERGLRAYMDATRPDTRYMRIPYHQFSETSSPKRLFWVIEKAWLYLRTDEERAWALAIVDRLAKEQAS